MGVDSIAEGREEGNDWTVAVVIVVALLQRERREAKAVEVER